MAFVKHHFGIQDIISVAVLAGTAAFLLQSKFDALAVRLSPTLRQAFTQWWPLLLIAIGMILLLAHYCSERHPRRARVE